MKSKVASLASAGAVFCLTALAAQAATPNLTGTWNMATGAEVTDRTGNPPIPSAPLKPEAAARYKADRARWKAAEDEGRPFARDRELCIPDGMPRMLTTDSPFDILETPGRITIIHEFMSQTRRIDMSGAGHPAEIEPGFFGDSVGRWDGDVLVVDTVAIKPRSLLFGDVPHGPNLHIVERFSLRAPDILEDEATITDPDVLERPWVVTRRFLRRPDLKVGESICMENNRNFRAPDGRLGTKLE